MSVAKLDTPECELTTPADRRRRLLLVAYNFPPVGGAGVQRPVKWCKYLRRFGWDVTVLTTENPSVPVRDDSLLADLPADVTVVRARTWEPDYRVKRGLACTATGGTKSLFARAKSAVKGLAKRAAKLALQPDPQVLWNWNALRAGTRALRERSHDAILVTAPAYSSFFIGASLKHRFGLPLILDYRDEWDLSGKYLENAQHDWFSRGVQSRMQRSLLRRADAVVATTRLSTLNLANKLATLRHTIPAACIYNGFDAEDFEEGLRVDGPSKNPSPPAPLPAKPGRGVMVGEDRQPDLVFPSTLDAQPSTSFRLVYTGTLWNLTDIEPLVKAVELLSGSRPELARRLELVCVGRKTPEQQLVLDRVHATTARVESIDYCDHARVLDWLHSAQGVCLLLSDVPGAERVVPAKLFEYLAIRKDLLAIAPPGETADIVRRFFPTGHCHPKDVSSIARWLEERLATAGPSSTARPVAADIHEFSREAQTARLAELLNELTSRCRK